MPYRLSATITFCFGLRRSASSTCSAPNCTVAQAGIHPPNIHWRYPRRSPIHQAYQPGILVTVAHRVFLLGFQRSPIFQRFCFLPLIGGAIQTIYFTTGKFFAVRWLVRIQLRKEKVKVDFAVSQGVEDGAEFPPETEFLHSVRPANPHDQRLSAHRPNLKKGARKSCQAARGRFARLAERASQVSDNQAARALAVCTKPSLDQRAPAQHRRSRAICLQALSTVPLPIK